MTRPRIVAVPGRQRRTRPVPNSDPGLSSPAGAPARPQPAAALAEATVALPSSAVAEVKACCGFLAGTIWAEAAWEPLAGDASARRYYRLRLGSRSAVLMDARHLRETVPPFVRIDQHLRQLGFSAPDILAGDHDQGLLLLEDFGDGTFSRLLDEGADPQRLYGAATDLLIAIHQHPQAIPADLRAYDPERMLQDLELFLDWCTPGISAQGRTAFAEAWRQVLPLAHQVPWSFLHRDYHAANLMWLPDRQGVQQVGVLDFQDAYQGPVTYDLMSLLEDARRDIPEPVRLAMLQRYLAAFPDLDRQQFYTSLAVVAAVRHTRVLAIFERLCRRDAKPAYKQLHSPRVQRLLRRALGHPALGPVRAWFETYAG